MKLKQFTDSIYQIIYQNKLYLKKKPVLFTLATQGAKSLPLRQPDILVNQNIVQLNEIQKMTIVFDHFIIHVHM